METPCLHRVEIFYTKLIIKNIVKKRHLLRIFIRWLCLLRQSHKTQHTIPSHCKIKILLSFLVVTFLRIKELIEKKLVAYNLLILTLLLVMSYDDLSFFIISSFFKSVLFEFSSRIQPMWKFFIYNFVYFANNMKIAMIK